MRTHVFRISENFQHFVYCDTGLEEHVFSNNNEQTERIHYALYPVRFGSKPLQVYFEIKRGAENYKSSI